MSAPRFRLRADALFVRTHDGVALHIDGGSFDIRGAGAYDLVASLFRKLDGTRTIDEIYPGRDAAGRAAVERVVKALEANGFLVRAADTPLPVPDWVAGTYGEHLAYLGQLPGCPMTRFTAIRSKTIAIWGGGPLLRALAGAAHDLGFARVILAADPQVADVVESMAARDREARWKVIGVAGGEFWRAPEVAGADALLIASDGITHRDLTDIRVRARAGGQLCGAVTVMGDVLVSAMARPEDEWCWECLDLWTRPDGQWPRPDDRRAGPVPRTAASAAAFHLAHKVFREFAGPPSPGEDSFVTVDCRTLTVAAHTPFRHPLCDRHPAPAPAEVAIPDDTPVRADIPEADSTTLDRVHDHIVLATKAWTDPFSGPFRSVGEHALPQLPLSRSECEVVLPGGAVTIRCAGLSARETRNQVVLEALARLATEALRAGGRPTGWVAAGWSVAEACYRALAAGSRRLLDEVRGPGEEHDVASGTSQTRAFLLGALSPTGPVTASAYELPTGLLGAVVRVGGVTAGRGVGLTIEHAIDGALLAAVAAPEPAGAVAELMPPVPTWAEALKTAAGRACDWPEPVEVTSALPFAGGHASIVSIPERPA